jgi:hypothetical protein
MNPYCLYLCAQGVVNGTLLTFQLTAKSPTPGKFQLSNVLEVGVVRLQTMYLQIGYHRKSPL